MLTGVQPLGFFKVSCRVLAVCAKCEKAWIKSWAKLLRWPCSSWSVAVHTCPLVGVVGDKKTDGLPQHPTPVAAAVAGIDSGAVCHSRKRACSRTQYYRTCFGRVGGGAFVRQDFTQPDHPRNTCSGPWIHVPPFAPRQKGQHLRPPLPPVPPRFRVVI